MSINNQNLYESEEVIEKYGANTTRVRSLNNAEKILIDRFDVKNKNVLVIGSGAGRVSANLLLYGNKVLGLDRSKRLTEIANKNFPNSKFSDLVLEEGDVQDLSKVSNEFYDVVFLPMNTIDYVDSFDMRQKAILEASKKVRRGGILAFSSHSKPAYLFSPKVIFKDRSIQSLFGNYRFARESVAGGGVIFKGNPNFVISDTERITGFSFLGFVCDVRTKIDKLFSLRLSLAQFFFPYILYVFRKK